MVMWEKKTIGKCAEIIGGGTPSTTVFEYWDGGILWCTPTDITKAKSKYLSTTERTISDKGLKDSAAILLPAGTILLCSRATIGEMCIAAKPISTNQGFKNLVCGSDVDNNFLYYLLQTKIGAMLELAIGSTFLEISKKALASIEIQLPPLPEQRCIAEALSDTDTLLAALEKLIAKKRAIKQGAMQELLAGKRRLPGSEGGFKNMNLVANSTLKARIGWQGLTTAEYLDSGYSYLITGTDFANGKIAWDTCHYVDKHRYDQDPNIQVVNGDVLITKDGTIGKVAIVSGLSKKATLNSGVFVLRPKSSAYDHRYVYYVLLSHIFTDFLDKLAAGSTINHLYQKDFINFEFDVPPTVAEQTAIAEILSDMDAEIDALTAKLNKLRHIKQGMMSELLTGRIRLVEQEATAAASVAPKTVELPKTKRNEKPVTAKGRNEYIEDAVILAVLAAKIGSTSYPFTAFDAQKFPYLLHRHVQGVAKGYKKFAAGPYNPELKYKGARPIALTRKYIKVQSKPYKGVVASDNIQEAKHYFEQWYGSEPLQWIEQFQFIKGRRDELELLTTVDMAIVELRFSQNPVTVSSVKEVMKNSKEWEAKLKREIFSDYNIARAINWSNKLFGQEV